ncbi:MAG: hypothetical protein ACOVPA_07800 [Rubrivivax sp.]|jgi:hypothetical protein
MALKPKQAKEHCGYQEKPVRNSCSNCAAFASDMEYPTWCKTPEEQADFDRKRYAKIEKNMRCTDHGFAVKKLALCNLWRA